MKGSENKYLMQSKQKIKD